MTPHPPGWSCVTDPTGPRTVTIDPAERALDPDPEPLPRPPADLADDDRAAWVAGWDDADACLDRPDTAPYVPGRWLTHPDAYLAGWLAAVTWHDDTDHDRCSGCTACAY